jgi:hypothetical protein
VGRSVGVSVSVAGRCHCRDHISTPNPPCEQWLTAVEVGAGRRQPLVGVRGGFHSVGGELAVSRGQWIMGVGSYHPLHL